MANHLFEMIFLQSLCAERLYQEKERVKDRQRGYI